MRSGDEVEELLITTGTPTPSQARADQMKLVAVGAPPSATAKPVVIDLPVVSGTGTVGSVISCTTGVWAGGPTYAYQWLSNAANVGTSVATYTTVAGDSGKSISCMVTGTNVNGSDQALSRNSIAIA